MNLVWIVKRMIVIIFICGILVSIFSKQITGLSKDTQGGIAISGSFYRNHFRLLPGEKFQSPDVHVVVFNNYDYKVEVEFISSVPNGVKMELESSKVSIPPHQDIKVPVGLYVSKDVVPGDYDVAISAEILPSDKAGIAISSSAQLRTKLTVFGEAGWVNIKTLDVEGEPFDGEVRLFYLDGNNLMPAGYSRTGKLEERLIPGEYITQVFFEGKELDRKSFRLDVDEKEEIVLKAETVYFRDFSITSPDSSDKMVSPINLSYSLENIYKPLKNMQLILEVYYAKTPEKYENQNKDDSNKSLEVSYKNNLLESVEIIDLPTLKEGKQSGRGTYVPKEGWRKGIYRFRLAVQDNEEKKYYATSQDVDLVINKNNTVKYLVGIVLVLIIVRITWYFFRKNKGIIL